ncbi:MAG: hypothetical protein ACKOAH_32660, partial [Pirellula sp.]
MTKANVWKTTVLGVALLSGTEIVFGQTPSTSEPVLRVAKNQPANTAPHPLDPALALARQSLSLMQTQVNDYTAVLIKRERIADELGDNEFMFIKVRNR